MAQKFNPCNPFNGDVSENDPRKKKNKKNKQLKEQAGDEKPDEKKAEDMTRKTDEPAAKQANEK